MIICMRTCAKCQIVKPISEFHKYYQDYQKNCKTCRSYDSHMKYKQTHPKKMRPTVQDRFWLKVNKTSSCWLWIGSKDSNGYGTFNMGRNEHGVIKYERPHRYAWFLTYGSYPAKGLVADHLCRVRSCCNPEHIEIVTPFENFRRGRLFFNPKQKTIQRGFKAPRLQTHCKRGHEFTEHNIYYRPDGTSRQCRICLIERYRKRNKMVSDFGLYKTEEYKKKRRDHSFNIRKPREVLKKASKV